MNDINKFSPQENEKILKKISTLIQCKPNGETDMNQVIEELNKGNKNAIIKNYMSYLEECEKNNKNLMNNLNDHEPQRDMIHHEYHHSDVNISGYQNIQDMNLQKRKSRKSKSNVKLHVISDMGHSEDEFEAQSNI